MGSSSSKGPSGFRICKVAQGSPGADGDLEVFFDYIVEVGGVVVESRDQSFSDLVKNFEEKPLKLTVYNCRTHALRDVTVIPHAWEGQGLLGLTVKYGAIAESENQGLRILEVHRDSPAAVAGLIPFRDYVIVSGDIIIRDSDDFAQLVSTHANTTLPLTVYNSDSESLREVSLVLVNGTVGCGIGTGVLHQIPLACKYAQNGSGLFPPHVSSAVSAQQTSGLPNSVANLTQQAPTPAMVPILTQTVTISEVEETAHEEPSAVVKTLIFPDSEVDLLRGSPVRDIKW